MTRRLAVVLALAAVLVSADAEARGGRSRPRTPEPPEDELSFRWLKSEERAIAVASKDMPTKPVMCFLRRADGTADRYYKQVIFDQLEMKKASNKDIAAFRVNTENAKGKKLLERHGIRRDGALLWYDASGNFLLKIDAPLKTNHISDTVRRWSSILANFEREVAKRVAEAKGQLERERYADALEALAPIIEIEGPRAKEMRTVLNAIEERGDALLGKVDRLGHGRTGRASLLASIAKEFQGSAIEARAKEMIGPATAAETRPSAEDAPGMPEPSIELMLRDVKKDAPEVDGGAGLPAGDDRDADDLLAAARERQSQGAVLLRAEDRVVAFAAFTDALDLAALALEKKPGNASTRRVVEGIAAQRYECFKSLVK